MKPALLLAACALSAALAVPAAACAHGGGSGRRLSDERTVTRWAHAQYAAAARTAPGPDAPMTARLRLFTEDGLPDVYVALRQRIGTDGRQWVLVRIARRPNGQSGWVPRLALGPLHTRTLALVLDKHRLRLTLYRRGRPVWRARAGIGRPGMPTPAGRFWIRERLRASGGPYGPYAFATSAYSVLSDWPRGGVVGLHGTDEPWLIPGRPSHGCVRLANRDITALFERWRLGVGTPLLIR